MVITVLAQLAVPAFMIAGRERTLKGGKLYRFTVQPDPHDAFRGRYVAIRLQVPAPSDEVFRVRQRAYAVVEERENGEAYFSRISRVRPQEGNYMSVVVRWTGDSIIMLQTPFDRFYLDEELAPVAEQVYRKHASVTNNQAFALIRIHEGEGVIEDIVVGGVPIRRAAAESRARP